MRNFYGQGWNSCLTEVCANQTPVDLVQQNSDVNAKSPAPFFKNHSITEKNTNKITHTDQNNPQSARAYSHSLTF